ncbi:hypothetical protein HY993_02545 [Candidatus Micrarchaeota archaeon]|nr:hypothetical protein [Candidatus Micrarchaeota archaeon]
MGSKPHSLVFFNGHGSKDAICGQQNGVLIDKENVQLLDSAIVYSRSCDSAARLGQKIVREGKAKAFIGYVEAFLFFVNNSRSATPIKDDYARPCLESSNVAPQSLIYGSTVGQAVEKTQKHFEKEIEYLKTHYSPENSHILFALYWNKAVLKAIGNQDAII